MPIAVEFSSRYLLGRFHVNITGSGEVAEGSEQVLTALNERIYEVGEGIHRVDNPVLMSLDGVHFPVYPSSGVPRENLRVPQSVVGEDVAGGRREILIAKRNTTVQLLNSVLAPQSEIVEGYSAAANR